MAKELVEIMSEIDVVTLTQLCNDCGYTLVINDGKIVDVICE